MVGVESSDADKGISTTHWVGPALALTMLGIYFGRDTGYLGGIVSWSLILWALFAAFLSAAVLVRGVRFARHQSLHFAWWTLPVFVGAGQALVAAHLPLEAWDAFDFWAFSGDRFFGHFLDERYRLVDYEFSTIDGRHSPLIPLFIGWLSRGSNFLGGHVSVVGIVWVVTLHATAWTICKFLVDVQRCRREAAALIYLIFITTPILENHALRYAYSELPTLFLLSSSMSCFVLALRRMYAKDFILGLLNLLALAYVRNTGIIFATIMLLALAFTFLLYSARSGATLAKARLSRRQMSYIVVVMAGVCFIGLTFLFQNPFGDLMVVGKRLGDFSLPFVKVSEYALHIFFKNASFNVLFLAASVFLLSALAKSSWEAWEALILFAFLATALVCLVGVFGPEYSRLRAAPGNDIGGTRWFMALVPLVFYMAAFLPGHVLIGVRGEQARSRGSRY